MMTIVSSYFKYCLLVYFVTRIKYKNYYFMVIYFTKNMQPISDELYKKIVESSKK